MMAGRPCIAVRTPFAWIAAQKTSDAIMRIFAAAQHK
jgi:hypothetical protein